MHKREVSVLWKIIIRKKQLTYSTRDLCGSYRCNELLGYDISTPEGAAAAKADKLFTEVCPKMVEKAVVILEGIINELTVS